MNGGGEERHGEVEESQGLGEEESAEAAVGEGAVLGGEGEIVVGVVAEKVEGKKV